MDLGDYGIIKEGAKCVWFDDKKIKQEEVFDVAVLKEWKTPALPASMNIPSTRW
jgi:hypothetical protein